MQPLNHESRCPRCHEGRLKPWNDLDDEEREIVRRLPIARESSLTERQHKNLWCTRCWHESLENLSRA